MAESTADDAPARAETPCILRHVLGLVTLVQHPRVSSIFEIANYLASRILKLA